MWGCDPKTDPRRRETHLWRGLGSVFPPSPDWDGGPREEVPGIGSLGKGPWGWGPCDGVPWKGVPGDGILGDGVSGDEVPGDGVAGEGSHSRHSRRQIWVRGAEAAHGAALSGSALPAPRRCPGFFLCRDFLPSPGPPRRGNSLIRPVPAGPGAEPPPGLGQAPGAWAPAQGRAIGAAGANLAPGGSGHRCSATATRAGGCHGGHRPGSPQPMWAQPEPPLTPKAGSPLPPSPPSGQAPPTGAGRGWEPAPQQSG